MKVIKLAFILTIASVLLLSAATVFLMMDLHRKDRSHQDLEEKEILSPNEWFLLNRTQPGDVFAYKAYRQALEQARQTQRSGYPGTNAAWTLEGPKNINGRVNCIAIHPQNSQIIYTGSASGGVFRSVDGGQTYTSVFDDFNYLAVSDITFDPKNPNIMYVGTGDQNISAFPFIGNGVYKSTDGGNTWNYSGLGSSYIVSDICVHPKCPDTIYAATMGLPFVRDNNRGLYKSTDGGQSWTQVLFLSNQAGIIELVMDPVCPDTLYAAGWDRIRSNTESVASGPAAKIYKTVNGGQTWTTLGGGLPTADMSRIGLWMSGSNHNTLFASYVSPSLELQGIYKTSDGGNNWTTINTASLPPDVMGGFGWYFGQVRVNPANDNDIFILGVDLWRTTDNGANWSMATPSWDQYIVHADKHDMLFVNSTSFLLATDGGLYKTTDNALNWTDADNTPTTQFYRVNYNPHLAGDYLGGAQDNGSLGGGVAQINSWTRYVGGDGFQPIVDPYDPSLRYYETQNGGLYYDDGSAPADFTSGIDPTDRRSWDMPVIMSRNDPARMYTGTYRVYRNTTAPYGTWSAISGDLTDGVIYGDRYHVITTVEESPVNPAILYAGTSDANVWYSPNAGVTWNNVTGILPQQYVTHIIASPTYAGTVYVAHSGYKNNDFIPHIHRSQNNGTSWTDISSNLPPLAINNIEVPAGFNDQLIFVATDGGVYYTINGGNAWDRLGCNMPLVAVYDIVYDTLGHKLIAGTYGRALQSYDLDSLITQITTGIQEGNEIENDNWCLSPNPCTDRILLKSNTTGNAKYVVQVYDMNGRLITAESFTGGAFGMNTSKLARGAYFLRITNAKGHPVTTQKFFKSE
jgi:photosystem II stability/assembly factor-like uncharacterized protein